MKRVLSLALLLLAPCAHAAGRAELVANLSLCQGQVAAPGVEPYSGLLPYSDFNLRWAWHSGFKLGLSSRVPLWVPSSNARGGVPAAGFPHAAALPHGAGEEVTMVSKAVVPAIYLLELTLPLFNPGPFNLSARLGAGATHWGANAFTEGLVSSPQSPDLGLGVSVHAVTFAWSALVNMEWDFDSSWAFRLYGGYVSLGKLNFGNLNGFRSDIGGITFGLGLGFKL